MKWTLCSERMPEQRQLCVVACYEWSMFDDGFGNVIKYRILEYLPDAGIWNIKEPLRVLAWIPIPEFTDQTEMPVAFSLPHPHKLEGRLCMPELEADEEDTPAHDEEWPTLAEAMEKIQLILKKAESRRNLYEKIRQSGQQLQQGR